MQIFPSVTILAPRDGIGLRMVFARIVFFVLWRSRKGLKFEPRQRFKRDLSKVGLPRRISPNPTPAFPWCAAEEIERQFRTRSVAWEIGQEKINR